MRIKVLVDSELWELSVSGNMENLSPEIQAFVKQFISTEKMDQLRSGHATPVLRVWLTVWK